MSFDIFWPAMKQKHRIQQYTLTYVSMCIDWLIKYLEILTINYLALSYSNINDTYIIHIGLRFFLWEHQDFLWTCAVMKYFWNNPAIKFSHYLVASNYKWKMGQICVVFSKLYLNITRRLIKTKNISPHSVKHQFVKIMHSKSCT